MPDKKDASGLTKQERHDTIIAYLKSINKPTKVFHLRWRPGDLLDGKILRSTPMFWFMKYQWSRPQIEEMFFKARLEIDDAFDSSLQQVFGGSPGARWRGGVEIPKQKKWKQRAEENARAWQGQQAQQVSREHVGAAVTDLEATQLREHDHANLLKNKLAQPINGKQTEVWNAVSDFGADKAIDYRTFSDNLKDRGINVSPLLAKQLFDQLADRQGKITRQEMDAIVRQLDQVKLPSDFASISWDDMNGKLGAQLIMKRVLLAASAGEPFNVDDFVFASKFGVSIEPVQFLGKLTDRDVEWDDRVRAMEALSANLGTNPMFNNVLSGANLPELLCGWSTQLLDSKPEVQKTAVDLMPHIFHEALEKGDPKIAVGHLEEIMDNLFKIIDDPKSAQNHAATKAAVDKIVADIINLKDPEAVLYLAGVLSEKCDLENVTSAPARAYALEQIQKIMFGAETPIVSSAPAKTSKIDFLRSLPKKGTANREWLDIAAKKQSKPSNNMYAEEELYDNESGNLPPRNVRSQEHAPSDDPSFAGVGDDEFMEGVPLDPAGPYANVASFPTNAMVKQPVKFDASKSHDCDRQPVKKYVWNFGDGSPEETTTTPVTKHAYDKPQVYPVTVTVTDKYGKSARAGLSQRVNDPKRILPPYAALDSDPPTQHVRKPVKFDASKSHDGDGNPVVSYVFDFGDGSDPVSTPKPVVNHAYEKKGAYPVKVTVTDKHGQTACASLTQRIIDPQAQDPTLPYAAVHSTPKDPVPRQPVRLDASQSVDCDGDPCKNYVWDFGDFSPPVTTTKPVVNHAYEKPGTYPVKVTVTDKYGKPAHASCKTMVVPASQPASNHAQEHILPPTVLLKSRPRETVPQQPVYFDASDSHDYQGNPCVSFLWDFGDDSPKVTTQEPYTTHPYAECGTYPVTVVGTDKFKQTGDASVNQRVRQPGPEDPYAAVRSTPKDPLPSQPVRIDASESVDRNGDPCKNFVFDFGDGSPPLVSPTPVVNHAYDAPGSYPVSVTVTDRAGKKANASLTQRIKDPKQAPWIGPPTAILSSQPKDTFPFEVVDFDASKSHDADGMPCRSFVWDFGDGTPKETTPGPLTQHKYAKVGSYPVVVQVTDKHGQKAHASVQQRVSPDVPYKGAKKITPNSKPAYASLTHKKDPLHSFHNIAPAPEFGRNDPAELKNDPTVPAKTGLTERHLPPYVGVRSTPTNANPQEVVKFDASESQDYMGDPCNNYVWDFGDGTPPVETTKPVANHAYAKPGSYPVKVSVVDKYGQPCSASLTQRVKDPANPHIGPPYAALQSHPKQTKPMELVDFDASQSHDYQHKPCVKFVWDFGDGTPNTTTDVPRTTHPYAECGTYPVTVTATDKYNQSAKASVSQVVVDEMTDTSAMTGISYRPQQHEAPQSGHPSHAGDGDSEVMESNPTYPEHNALATYYDPIDPYAALRSTPPIAKPQQKVRFDASDSQDANGDPPLEYQWNFGDSTPVVTTNKPFIDHAYAQPGTYPASVTVVDTAGNPASASLTQRVQSQPAIGPPYAALKSQPKETLQYEPVDFDASDSQDYEGKPCVSFKWDFGDGTPMQTTPGPLTKHAYERPGGYPVRVTAVDKHGQEADATVSQRVITLDPTRRNDQDPLGPPVAYLEGRPKTTVPNHAVTFDASQSHDCDHKPCVSFLWDFGDGSPNVTTKEPITKHPYAKIGHYNTTVTVTDKHGQKARAHTNTEVTDSDPVKNSRIDAIRPPNAVLESVPKETQPKEVVDFDASKSKDMYGKPCVSFFWDFGDGSPNVTTKEPTTKHPYKQIGTYPVTVTVKDKNGLTDKASVSQLVTVTKPVSNSASQDPLNKFRNVGTMEKTDPAYAQLIDSIAPPVAHLEGTPKVTTPNQLVDLDASRSHDFQGGPCVEFGFEFGDGTPNVTQQSPYVKHAYQQIGHYPASVTVADKWQQRAKAHCNQKVIDSDPSRNHRVDMIRPPEAHLINDPPVSKPEQMVALDASKSKDMYDQPCVSFKWDFGDGSPQQTTTGPLTQHAFPAIGHYPVTVTVKDKNGLTANASVNQKVIDPMPSYQGNRSIAPVPDFGRSDPDELKDEPSYDRMDPIELGDEFRGITSEAISKALMDPNPQNSKKAKKMTDVMKQLNPQWPDEELDPEAKNRYNRMNFPIKPFKPKLPPKPKIGIKGGKAVLEEVDFSLKVDFGSFEVPDI